MAGLLPNQLQLPAGRMALVAPSGDNIAVFGCRPPREANEISLKRFAERRTKQIHEK